MINSPVDESLVYFYSLCDQLEVNMSLNVKQEIIKGFIARFSGDMVRLFRLLLPKFAGRLYHLQDKQIAKIIAPLLGMKEAALTKHIKDSGCVGKSVRAHFKPSADRGAALTMVDLDSTLDALSKVTKEDEQTNIIAAFFKKASPNDVFLFLRQIKQDLRLGAGIRVILGALHPSANDLYKQSANVEMVVKRVLSGDTEVTAEEESVSPGGRSVSPAKPMQGMITINTPLAPMLAEPSKGLDHVLGRCANGAYSETKYDGERIQIHKDGDSWKFFSRSLKPMKADKYEGLDVHLKAAVGATSCILDGEILLVDLTTGQPLPFGTLGKHKKAQFKTACTCIFLFDIMYLNGKSVISEPLNVRRALLKRVVTPIKYRIHFSELHEVKGSPEERLASLRNHLAWAITEGLEGLVCKDVKSVYTPGDRRWVKLKKDYIDGMADSADLVVLGAYYGTGNKGGILSVFLMGVLDHSAGEHTPKRFKTVCKLGSGFDDAAIAALNETFKVSMAAMSTPPTWIDINNSVLPDVYIKDPMEAPVWEIIAAEFSASKTHTAAGISMRFPRVLKERDDKSVTTATSLAELQKLNEASRQKFQEMGMNFAGKAGLVASGVETTTNADIECRVEELIGTTASAAAAPFPPPAAHQAPQAPLSARETTLPFANDPAEVIPAGLQETSGDAAQPIVSAGDPHQNMLIAHCVAIEGGWSDRGTMGTITKFLGEEPRDEYLGLKGSLKLGTVLFSEVTNRQSKGKLVVATMVAQSAAARGSVPQVQRDALRECVSKCMDFAKKHHCSIHISRLVHQTGVKWDDVESQLKEGVTSQALNITVYARHGRQQSLVRIPTDAPIARAATATPVSSVAAPAEMPSVLAEPSMAEECLAGARILLSGLTARDAEAVKQKVMMMGGAIATSIEDATLIVSNQHVAGARANCVRREWVDDSFIKNSRANLRDYLWPATADSLTSEPSDLFGVMKSCSIVFDGFDESTARELKTKVTMMGAKAQDKWSLLGSGATTHMVCSGWSANAKRARQQGGAVVSRLWVDACVQQGRLQDIVQFAIKETSVNEPPVAHIQTASVPVPAPAPARVSFSRASSTETEYSTHDESEPLKGMRFVTDGYGSATTAKLRGMVTHLGGTLVDSLHKADVLICDTLTTISTTTSVTVLRRRWVEQCDERRRKVPQKNFVLRCTAPASNVVEVEDTDSTPSFDLPADDEIPEKRTRLEH